MVTTPVTVRASTEQVEAYKKMLSSVPKLEMPARAAREVSKAKANKKQVARDVLTAAIAISPASAAAIVRAISRVAPECGPEIVTAASLLQPQQAMAIQAAMPIVSAAPMVGSPVAGGTLHASEITPAGGGVEPPYHGGGEVHDYIPRHTVIILNPRHDYSVPGW
jgi:hypothetical protein